MVPSPHTHLKLLVRAVEKYRRLHQNFDNFQRNHPNYNTHQQAYANRLMHWPPSNNAYGYSYGELTRRII